MLDDQSFHEKESQALFDEAEFARRYGVTWPRRDREALLDFQREVHLSDQQIRYLNRSKSLKWSDSRIEVHGPTWIAVGGYYNIAILWLVLGSQLLFGAHHYGYTLRAVSLATVGCSLLWLASRYMWLHSVFPYKVNKRAIEARAQVASQDATNLVDFRRAG